MYTEFFGLNEKPFSISPDPRYLYLSRRHADALAHLIYGISESGGFIQLTGEVGTGKTTLIRSLLEQLPEKAEVALILNPQLSDREFLQSICQELRLETPSDASVKDLIDKLNEHLLQAHANGKRVVLIVDEAQTLSPALLEQVRLLTNLETAKQKLLQIILIGQPELRQLLDRPEMRQIAQRITGRYHLEPLSLQDTIVYLRHRMKVAGAHAEVFTPSAIREIFRQSKGIPRLINVVADRALLAAYTKDRSKIDGRLVKLAAAEVFGKRTKRRWWPWAVAGSAGIVAFAVGTTDLWRAAPPEPTVSQPLALAAAEEGPPAPVTQSIPLPLPEPDPPTLAESLLEGLPSDDEAATRALFALWNAPYDAEGGGTCAQAELYGLRCMYLAGGSIGELRQIDRPVILSLWDSSGSEHKVVLSRLSYDHALLLLGEHELKVEIAELSHYRFGNHLLFWEPLSPSFDGLAPGMRNDGVAALRRALAEIRGAEAEDTGSTFYDAGLESWVREYQRERNLAVDGIAGAQTQIAVRTDLGLPSTPMLTESE